MAGLSAAGFERKRLPDIKFEIEAALKVAFGEDIDLRSESVFGQLVGVFSLPISEQWEELENVYLSFDPDFAEGVSLDALGALTGVTRIEATATVSDAILYGDFGTIIPALSEARSAETEEVYCLEETVTISASSLVRAATTITTVASATDYTVTINGTDYTVTSDADATKDEILLALDTALDGEGLFSEINTDGQILFLQDDLTEPFSIAVSSNMAIAETASPGVFFAKEKGVKFLPAGELNEIQTNVSGWESVTNPVDGVSGRNIETDSEFRIRRRDSVSFPGQSTVDAILSRLLEVDDIKAAKVYENNTDTTDANGVTANSIWAIVDGGEPDDIANIIYTIKAGGIGTYGDTSVNYESDSGQEYLIKFERPTETPLHIEMTILPTDGYQAESVTLIKEAIAAWVEENISIGDNLKYSRLFTPINSVTGFEVTELLIGKTASPTGAVSLTAAIDELIQSDTTNINITVT